MSPAVTPERVLSRTWKHLGAPAEAPSALVMESEGWDLARAVRDELAPRDLLLMHPEKPPARSRFHTTPATLAELALERPAAFDLVAVGGLQSGTLSEVRRRLVHIARLLKPGGVLAAALETFAAPDPGPGAHDHLLFPHLTRTGDLGEDLRTRALLPWAAWTALIQTAGFDIVSVEGLHGQILPQDFRTTHQARLAAYDDAELAHGTLQIVARRTETLS